MPSLKTQFSVGLFVIAGVLLGIFIIIWLGLSNYLEKGHYFVSFFDESVQGLEKDSPVKYRGVSVGSVDRVGVAPDQHLIEVVMKIESGIEPEKNLDKLVAQLKSVGITGLMFIELERKKENETNFSPQLSFTPDYPVISTRPSEISQIIKGIDDIIRLVKDLDFKGISMNLVNALKKVSAGMEDADIKKISASASQTLDALNALFSGKAFQNLPYSVSQTSQKFQALAETGSGVATNLNQTIIHLNRLIKDNNSKINTTIESMEAVTVSMKTVLDETTLFVGQSQGMLDTMQVQLSQTMIRLQQTINQFNSLLEEIKDHPSLLFFGESPPKKRINQ